MFLRVQDRNVQLRTDDLDSLSIPLNRLAGGRYTIPILAAPYYEVAVKPAPGGGFPQHADGTPATATLRIWFNEGNGIAFRSALAAAQEQHEAERHWVEPLRAYSLRSACVLTIKPGTRSHRRVSRRQIRRHTTMRSHLVSVHVSVVRSRRMYARLEAPRGLEPVSYTHLRAHET